MKRPSQQFEQRQENYKKRTFLWGQFNLSIQGTQNNKLVIKLQNNKDGKTFVGIYEFEDMSNQIKNTYGALSFLLEDLLYIVSERNHDRLKVKENGQIIFCIKTQIAGKVKLIEQILKTEEIVHKQLRLQEQIQKTWNEFQIFKTQKNKQLQQINQRIRRIEEKHQSRWEQMQKRILQLEQKEQLGTQNKELMQKHMAEIELRQEGFEKKYQELQLKLTKDLELAKIQLMVPRQKIEQKPAKDIDLQILKNQLNAQKEELHNFANFFTQQIQQLKVLNEFWGKKYIMKENFKYASKISNILKTQQQCQNLFNLFQKKIKNIKLLFKASQHNFYSSKFHQFCDGIPNTLVLVKTEFNKIIGGFTTLQWDKNSLINYVQDETLQSFIFSLTNKDRFYDTNTGHSIHNHPSYGPCFGAGHDLMICDESNKDKSSYSRHCSTYKNGNYQLNTKQSWQKFQGSSMNHQFLTIQYEVYQVRFE